MKALKLITGIGLATLMLSACSSAKIGGPGYLYDDVYYTPGKSRENYDQAFSPVPSMSNEALKAEKKEAAAQRNEYQQAEIQDTRDFSAIQQEYSALLSDDVSEPEVQVYYDESGYWVGGFNGSDMERDYAERLIRFHGPSIRVSYFSPIYSELVFYNYDWNMYVDGNYVYVVPTWTNRWYDYYYYNNWYSPWYFGWGYNSWYYGYGWGYPYYYSHWYSPYYYDYWYSPCYCCHHHNHYYGGNDWGYNNDTHYGSRLGTGSVARPLASRGLNSGSSRQGVTGSSLREGGRTMRDTQRVTGTDGRTSRDNTNLTSREGGRTSQGGETSGRVTRNSYTPSYSTSEGSARPAYNRGDYSRVNNGTRPSQTTGTVQGSSSTTRQVGTTNSGTTGTRQPASTSGNTSVSRPSGSTSSGSTSSGSTSSGSSVSRPSGTSSTGTSSRQSSYQQGSSSSSRSSSSYSTPSSSSGSRGSSSSGSSSSSYRSSGSSSSSGSSYSSGSSGSSGSRSSGSSSSGSSSGSRSGGSSSSGGRR